MSNEPDQINQLLNQALLAAVDQQIHEKNPPETLSTLERLQEEGFSEAEAKNLIALVVSYELASLVEDDLGFNQGRYVAALERLPEPFARPRVKEDEF